MPRKHILAAVMVLVAFAAWLNSADAADWWGHRLPSQPINFIFGYGSLINSASRNASAKVPIPAIPVRVSATFGYIRVWNDRSSTGFTALGLRKPHQGESASTINGVLYPVADDDMGNFDRREAGYARVEVPLLAIESVSWQRLPEQGHVWVYVPVPMNSTKPGAGEADPSEAFPLLESYVDVVIEGALEYGPDFARELIETTGNWSHFWLNDRDLARRPWVHDARYSAVDSLLAGTEPASSAFPDRLLSEPYAARWLIRKAP